MSYDIIILAGQSNADGNGVYKKEDAWISDGKVMQLVDANPATIYEEPVGSGNGIMVLTLPTKTEMGVAKDRIFGENAFADITRSFTDCYISAGLLKKDRKILVIKSALGGAGFAKNQWGVDKPLYKRLVSMIDDALKTDKDNKVIAFLWHQGEHDAYENAQMTEQERYDFYYKNLKEQTLKIREKFNYTVPFIAGEFVNDWASLYKKQCDTVEKATKDICKDIGNAGLVSSEGLLSNAQAIEGNGDNIHFSYSSINELGKRYFEKYLEIKGIKSCKN